MLDDALNGTFSESSYDETKLSRLESKWKEFLGTSVLSNQNLEAERHRLEQFISDISHQTKTPMTNIKMYTELLCEEIKILQAKEGGQGASDISASLSRIEKYSAEIRRQNERLEFLIDSLTKLSRLESGTLEVVANKSSVNELVDSGIAAVKAKAGTKEISIITADAEGDTPLTASFDMKWTLEALINVLDNAVKYSPEGGKIEVKLSETEMYVAIHVIDEGRGISEEEATKIFGRFFRGSEVQQDDGVGIGLYLTREILSKEDGYIKVITNEVREGGEFVLYLRK
ncbi:MAG: HAMP domain-containing histidine kinase [Eubacterium sp.]|nr:HAMP domain-containing histidine kinase [Eubacterium sp.]